MTTGQKIYELRKNARITQEQFAERLEVSRQAVSKWESDAAYPETDKIIKIAELFGVSCDYLLKDGAEAEDGVLPRRRRALFTMLITFAAACCAAGYLVAVICYYCIDMHESSLIGLGVLAAFLLARFILWQVGRYRFLNECDYTEEDKTHLAKLTKAWYYASIIAFFCYLPTVVMINLQGVIVSTINTSWQEIFVYRNMNAGEFIITLITFAAAGYGICRLGDIFYDRSLGQEVSKADIADCIVVALLLLLCAVFVTVGFYLNYYDLLGRYGYVDFDAYGMSLLMGISLGIILPVLLATQAVLHRVYNKTPKALFAVCITACVVLAGSISGTLFEAALIGLAAIALCAAALIAAAVLVIVFAKKGDLCTLYFFKTAFPSGIISCIVLTDACFHIYYNGYYAAYYFAIVFVLVLSVIVSVLNSLKFDVRKSE